MSDAPFAKPVELYMWGDDWQLRDPQRRTICKFIVMSRDLNYQAQMKSTLEYIAGLINNSAVLPAVASEVQEEKPKKGRRKRSY